MPRPFYAPVQIGRTHDEGSSASTCSLPFSTPALTFLVLDLRLLLHSHFPKFPVAIHHEVPDYYDCSGFSSGSDCWDWEPRRVVA
jgi:hypothetical protein